MISFPFVLSGRRAAILVLLGFFNVNSPGALIAGPNTHGQLVLHARPDLEYSIASPAGLSEVSACEDVVAAVETEEPLIWFVLGLFPLGTEPEVGSIRFGIDYDPADIEVVDAGFTDASVVALDRDWPGPGAMANVTFSSPRTDLLFEVGWFRGGAVSNRPSSFELGGRLENRFFDANGGREAVARLGRLGFFQPGLVLCDRAAPCCFPDGSCRIVDEVICYDGSGHEVTECDETCTRFGACCLDPEADCQFLTRTECVALGGEFAGEGVTCTAAGCRVGTCCIREFRCELLTEPQCAAMRGSWDDSTDIEECVRDCCCGPLQDGSWGTVKSRFRGRAVDPH